LVRHCSRLCLSLPEQPVNRSVPGKTVFTSSCQASLRSICAMGGGLLPPDLPAQAAARPLLTSDFPVTAQDISPQLRRRSPAPTAGAIAS
jgi:hypothetical protein